MRAAIYGAPIAGRAEAARTPLALALAAAALVGNAFLLRPAALGQQYVPVAMVLGVAIVGAHLLASPDRAPGPSGGVGRDIAFVIAVFVAFWIYELGVSFARRASDETLLAKELLSGAVVVCGYGFFLADARANAAFFRTLATVVSLLGWSALITTGLALLVGAQRLYLTTVAIEGYRANVGDAATGAIYFPLSMQYASYDAGAVKLMRFCNFFREAGIYQAVSLFLLAYERLTRRSPLVTVGLLAGTILSFSTIGLLLLPATLCLVFVARRRLGAGKLVLVGALGAAIAVSMAVVPAVGLLDKIETHGASVDDRSFAIRNGLQAAASDPLGAGMFSPARKNDGICLLAAVGSIGVLGVLLQAVVLSGLRPGGPLLGRRAVVCFPLFVTALLSQPIAGQGLTYILAMVMVPPESSS
jgi:hypothetical protein